MQPFLQKQQEKCLEQAWQAALPLLLSPDISNGNEFTAPWLDYEPYLNGETDVYFLLDEPQVKWSTKTGHRVRVFPVSIFRFVWG